MVFVGVLSLFTACHALTYNASPRLASPRLDGCVASLRSFVRVRDVAHVVLCCVVLRCKALLYLLKSLCFVAVAVAVVVRSTRCDLAV